MAQIARALTIVLEPMAQKGRVVRQRDGDQHARFLRQHSFQPRTLLAQYARRGSKAARFYES